MAFELARIHLFDRNMEPVPEIAPSELISAVMSEEINGEHELVITTTRRLEEGWRALTVDATGKWREWVVTETPQEHSSGAHAIGTYRFVWSLQYDLTNSYFHDTGEAVSIGMGTDTTASTAAQYIVDAAVGWTVGNCDAPDIEAGTGCVFIRESAWSKLSKLVECTGFEVDSDIDVDRVHAGISGSDQYCVRNRDIILTSHVGSEVATRRFDWGYDIANIKRTPDPGPYYCRVVPLGKGEQEYADDDETTFDYPIDITEEVDEHGNPYPYYLQDDEAAAVFRIKSSYDGSWIYPTIAVSYNEDDPELLLKAAQEDLHKYTRPNVTYEADVLQFSQAGMDVRGVALGDEIQIVDHGFNPDAALRLQGRVTKIETDLLSPETGTTLTIGNLRDNMADAIAEANSELDALVSQNADIRKSLAGMNTTRYVQELLERINTEIAATGGYTYLVEGEGLITYDKAVVDPLSNLATDGTYATRVIQLKGGYLRIAEDTNASLMGIDDWNFTTLLEAGHIVSDLVTAVKITAGYIGNANNGNYWNLDTGQIILSNGYIGDTVSGNYWNLGTGELVLRMLAGGWTGITTPVQQITTTHGVVAADDHLYDLISGTTITGNGRYLLGLKIENRTYDNSTQTAGNITGQIMIVPTQGYTVQGYPTWDSIVSSGNMRITSNFTSSKHAMISLHESYLGLQFGQNYSFSRNKTYFNMNEDVIEMNVSSSYNAGEYFKFSSSNGIEIKNAPITINDDTYGNVAPVTVNADATVNGEFSALGLGVTRLRIRTGPHLNVGTDGDTSGYDGGPGNGSIYAQTLILGNSSSQNGSLRVYGTTKSRVVETKNYGARSQYCYETPSPMFGDVGSGCTDEDGLCYVQIDDLFLETVIPNGEYQVFLQKCGPGDIWVDEKHENYFVVKGTANLNFDWELKAHQVGTEHMRLDDDSLAVSFDTSTLEATSVTRLSEAMLDDDIISIKQTEEEFDEVYGDYAHDMESIFDDELAA